MRSSSVEAELKLIQARILEDIEINDPLSHVMMNSDHL